MEPHGFPRLTVEGPIFAVNHLAQAQITHISR
jgi:hypothetical protein